MEIVLVDKSYDDRVPPARLLEPQMGNMQRSIVKNREALMAVVALLESKGVVNAEERSALLDVPQAAIDRGLRQFDRVRDLDSWPFE